MDSQSDSQGNKIDR